MDLFYQQVIVQCKSLKETIDDHRRINIDHMIIIIMNVHLITFSLLFQGWLGLVFWKWPAKAYNVSFAPSRGKSKMGLVIFDFDFSFSIISVQ